MRITIITIGTRGDVQPLVALGLGLQRAGHTVSVATSLDFEVFVNRHGLRYLPIEIDFRALLETQAGRKVMDPGPNILQSLVSLRHLAQCIVHRFLHDSWAACQDAEAVIYGAVATIAPVEHIREALNIPCYQARVQPSLFPTRSFGHPTCPPAPPILHDGSWTAGTYNRLTYFVLQQLFWQPLRRPMNQWRQETVNLPPTPFSGPYRAYHHQRLPGLHGFSPRVVPKPADWPGWQHVTGYWFLDCLPSWRPPADLVDFLASGPPPICVTFGSTLIRNSEALTDTILKALARTRQRAVLLNGWGGLSQTDLPDEVLKVDSVPYDWLFPQAAAVLHHGGAGTTAAALRAGIPSVTIPIFADHPFWARRIAALGVGLAPLSRRRLTIAPLVAAIQTAIQNQAMRSRAAHFGQIIRAENGVERAVEAFHRHL